jgi:uncharacterized membrane protein YhdT
LCENSFVNPALYPGDIKKSYLSVRLSLNAIMENLNSEAKKPDDVRKLSSQITIRDLSVILVICLLAGALVLMPKFVGFDPYASLYYAKNAGMIAFAALIAYNLTVRKKTDKRWLTALTGIFVISAVFINLLPSDSKNQSVVLACIHLPLMLWCFYSIVYTGFDLRDTGKRVSFIRHNGDMAILGALILLSGMLLAGLSIGLFSSIEINIQKFVMEYIAIWGVVAAPALTEFILHHYPRLTEKIAPVLASIFTPIVLITLVIYLIAIIFSGKDPYTDRDFLILFNLMLLVVMALIVFSLSETSEGRRRKISEAVLLALSVVTLVVDIVALSAIFYRLSEYGITPNRVAVLGSNLLILGNLILITIDLFRVTFRNASFDRVNVTTAKYLPVYLAWTIIVVFGFPIIF